MKIKKDIFDRCLAFKTQVVDLIHESKQTNQKIELARWLGRFLTHNFVSVYSCEEIEEYLANYILKVSKSFVPKEKSEGELAVLATTLYKHGGHTRMIEGTLTCFNKFEELILVQHTNSDNMVVERLRKIVQISSVDAVSESPEDKILYLYNKLTSYKSIVLYINPDDIESALAIKIDKILNPNLRVYFFVNHSDHTFSYGRSSSDKVLEVSNYGWTLGRQHDLGDKQSFLGIPINNATIDSPKKIRSENQLVISGGAAYKFKSAGGFSLRPYLSMLLKSNKDVTVCLVGPGYYDSMWIFITKIFFPSRFKCVKRLDYLAYRELLSKTNVYIDSYPITGGTAFTEALLNGLKVIGISGCPCGYGYADKLRAKNVDGFVSGVQDLLDDKQEAIKYQSEIRGEARRYHSFDAFEDRLNRIVFQSENIKQEEFAKNQHAQYDFVDIFNREKKIHSPELIGIDHFSSFMLLVLGVKNKLGILFSLKLIARWMLLVIHQSRKFALN
jgi:hypothetical protein